MDEIVLDVQIRDQIGRRKVKEVRREDCVPAVVYGGSSKKATAIKVDRRSYEKIARQHKNQSVLFHINVFEGDKKLKDYAAIVKEEQLHPVQDSLVHIDFQRVSLKKEIEVMVAIVLKGEPIGVKKDGGSLDQPLKEIDVLCLPTDIPEKIDLDISALEIGDALHVSDIKFPVGVRSKHDSEAMICSVVPPMKDADDVEEESVELEVTGEKKDKGEKADSSGKGDGEDSEDKAE